MEGVATTGGDDRPELSFEEILAKLTRVVERLETGDLPLEESLAVFEEGIQLSRLGSHRLDAAEAKVEELLGESMKTVNLVDDESQKSR
ncbi:MAG: exodeoxyribonuclease VII small subunit [Sandaracinaceae bacterium]|nr:exodeoxyribonuclease VII small subunit [Sandaracinaceae bacterium]